MSPYTPGTDLWLERSRLDGMLLSAVSYGIFFLLTIQATVALIQGPLHGGQITHHRWMSLGYVWVTFVLATIGFAGNARYTEMIWVDLRNVSGRSTALILDEMNHWINTMALTCYYIMEWLMQALLGIAQLLIIICVARGKAFQHSAPRTLSVHPPTSIVFVGTLSNKGELERPNPLPSTADMERGTRSLKTMD